MNRRGAVIASAVFLGIILVTGCASKQPSSVVSQAQGKPPLAVPASFSSQDAKKDFAVKAVDQGYYTEAEALLREVVETAPDGRSYANLGTVLYQKGDLTGALNAWSKAAELDPARCGEMFNNIGNALRDSGKLAEGKVSYEKALKVEPTRWTAAVNLATILHTEGKLDDAVKVLKTALPANPNATPLISLLDAYNAEVTNTKNS